MPQSSRLKIFLWSLYDFANSLAFSVVSFYFVLWFVQDNKLSDMWISVPVALATIILLVTLPAFGGISDETNKRMPFLRLFTILAIGTLLILGIVGINNENIQNTPWILAIVILCYFGFQYFYQASLAFYDAFIQNLATETTREKVSGYGMAAGQLGNVVGLIIAAPIAEQMGRPATFIAGAILFLLFSLPVLIFLKDEKTKIAQPESLRQSLKNTWKNIKLVKQYPEVFNYLLTYYFFADAILTLQLFTSLYLEKVGGLDDKEKTLTFVIALATAIFGALLSGKMAKLIKSTRKTIALWIALWAIFLGLFAFAKNPVSFAAITILNGFAFGVLFSLSRAYFSEITPAEHQGKFFSIYVLFERFASVLGPLIWSATILVFGAYGEETKYRFAMLSLGILVAISFAIFQTGKRKLKTT